MYPWKEIKMLILGYGNLLPRGGFPCFCDRVIISSIILFDWKYRGNHTSREKIKSCYWGDLKEAKVVRNHRGTFREQQAIGWGQVQGKVGEGRRRVQELCNGLWIQPHGQGEGAVSVRRNSLVQAELFWAGSGAGRGSQSPVQKPRSKPYECMDKREKQEQEACPEGGGITLLSSASWGKNIIQRSN